MCKFVAFRPWYRMIITKDMLELYDSTKCVLFVLCVRTNKMASLDKETVLCFLKRDFVYVCICAAAERKKKKIPVCCCKEVYYTAKIRNLTLLFLIIHIRCWITPASDAYNNYYYRRRRRSVRYYRVRRVRTPCIIVPIYISQDRRKIPYSRLDLWSIYISFFHPFIYYLPLFMVRRAREWCGFKRRLPIYGLP